MPAATTSTRADFGKTPDGTAVSIYTLANKNGLGARITLDGRPYQLQQNDGDNTLHGGAHGFDKRVWTPRPLPDGGLELTYLSRDGEGGFPGNVTATVTYHLTDANELHIDYTRPAPTKTPL